MIGAAVTSVASKVIGLVPGVGKAAGMALKGAAKGLTKASDAIHAPLGKGLTKAMSGMHTAANPPG